MTSSTIFPQSTWRLIKTPPARGAWNMAVDEAILITVGKGVVPTTLRLYAWEPPCISLGYAQPANDIDQTLLKQQVWDLVRRPTGGRAILHTDEITYAVIGSYNEPRFRGDILESYQTLSQALLLALKFLGIPAESLPTPPGYSSNKKSIKPVCFEVPSKYEITVHGKKLIGSAQARKKTGILQHGSLPLYGDLTRIITVLSLSNKRERTAAASRLLNHACTIQDVLKKEISWEEAADALVQGFTQALNLNLQPAELSNEEIELAEQIMKTKYTNPQWTFKN